MKGIQKLTNLSQREYFPPITSRGGGRQFQSRSLSELTLSLCLDDEQCSLNWFSLLQLTLQYIQMYVSGAVSNSDSARVVLVSTPHADFTGGGAPAVTLGLRQGSETRAGDELDSRISAGLLTENTHVKDDSCYESN